MTSSSIQGSLMGLVHAPKVGAKVHTCWVLVEHYHENQLVGQHVGCVHRLIRVLAGDAMLRYVEYKWFQHTLVDSVGPETCAVGLAQEPTLCRAQLDNASVRISLLTALKPAEEGSKHDIPRGRSNDHQRLLLVHVPKARYFA